LPSVHRHFWSFSVFYASSECVCLLSFKTDSSAAPQIQLNRRLLELNPGPSCIIDLFILIQHCFICRPSDPIVSEDARIEPRTVATLALSVRRSNYVGYISSTHISRTGKANNHYRLRLENQNSYYS
jgi:hypothetical protein